MTHSLNQEDLKNLEILEEQIRQVPGERRHLNRLLQMAQNTMGYLPDAAISMVAKHLSITRSQVYGVASFYNQFRFTPPGRNQIKVCMGTACHVKGGEIILENFERKLDIKEGETTPDREFSIERVACVGCCALAPVTMIGKDIHGHMAPSKVEGLVLQMNMKKAKKIKATEEQ